MAKKRDTRLKGHDQQILSTVKMLLKGKVLGKRYNFENIINENLYNEAIAAISVVNNTMIDQYFQECLKQGIFDSYEDLMKNNIIRVQECNYKYLSDILSRSYDNMTKEELFLYSIPCFRTGVLLCNDTSDDLYMKWDVKNIDVNKYEYQLCVEVYSRNITHGSTFGLIYKAEGKVIKGGFYPLLGKELTCGQVGELISYKRFGWSPLMIEVYKAVIRYSDINRTLEMARSIGNTKISNANYEFYITKFVRTITAINLILRDQRISKAQKTPVTNFDKDKKKSFIQYDQEAQEKRRYRTLNCVDFFSDSIPKIPTKESVIHYNIASWNVRGHVRRYKSGKVVYIKPTTRHRKALKDIDSQPASTVITIQNNLNKGEMQNEQQ